MSLLEVISKLETFNEESTIYAAKPWTDQSKTLVLNESETGGLSIEAKKEDLKYFLEISIAKEFLDGWMAHLDTEPTIREKCKRLIQYAINDA